MTKNDYKTGSKRREDKGRTVVMQAMVAPPQFRQIHVALNPLTFAQDASGEQTHTHTHRLKLIEYRMQSGDGSGAFLHIPAPLVDKIPGPVSARFSFSTGLQFGTLLGREELLPARALDKSRTLSLPPTHTPTRTHIHKFAHPRPLLQVSSKTLKNPPKSAFPP